MKCVCEKWKQIRGENGKKISYRPGMVGDFKECPSGFRPLAGEAPDAPEVDFETANEQELMEAEFDLPALKAFIEEKYGVKAGNRGRDKTIALLLDARFRKLDVDPNDMVV